MHIIANWKSHFDLITLRTWVETFLTSLTPESTHALHTSKITLCIAPSTPLLYPLKCALSEYPFHICAQDVSVVTPGAHTGEVSAESLAHIATYCLVGHLERRRIGETSENISQKISRLAATSISSVLCISHHDEYIHGANFVAFEPSEAVGSGQASDPAMISEHFSQLAKTIAVPIFYGGSVTSENIIHFLKYDNIKGFLCGSASLDPFHLSKIIHTVATHA
jgi:triosephosphate isomerase